MTRPFRGDSEGDAYIEVHADTRPFADEAERGVRKGAEQAEDDLDDIGDKWGETLADAAGDRLEKEGPQLARAVERGLERQKVTVKTRVVYDKDNNVVRQFVETTTTAITRELTDAFAASGSGGGPLGKVGQALSDAIGAGFNVSGRSPLIAFLIPVIGAIVGLVIAAIQAVNALIAVLITVPGIIASIGLQVGVLMVAFNGVGTAVQGAFAAKNAQELKLALKDLTPAAQEFVRSLLPLKDFFKSLQYYTQQSFFKAFGADLIPQLLKFQGGRIFAGFQSVATALGTAFRELGFFFNSDTFAKFLDEVFPRTVTFLEQFGPAFITFLEGLLNLANAAMPFMTEVGGIVSMVFKQLGDYFSELAADPDFQVWLSEMRETLDEVVTLLKVAFIFVGQLMDSLNQAGAEKVITELSKALLIIGDVLASEVGISAMKGFIEFGITAIQVVAGLILAIIFTVGMLTEVVRFIKEDLIPAIGGFFGFLWDKVKSLWNSVVAIVTDFVEQWKNAGTAAKEAIASFANSVKERVSAAINNVITFVKSVPDRIRQFFSDAGSWLVQAGKNILNGLINGIKSKFGELWATMKEGATIILDFWPFSPAKEGPLSGKGDPMLAGQRIVTRLAAGMEMEAPRLQDASMTAMSNVTFGPNSIQMRFSGIPSQEQAMAAGGAVANGIYTGLARDTRLAVRTL